MDHHHMDDYGDDHGDDYGMDHHGMDHHGMDHHGMDHDGLDPDAQGRDQMDGDGLDDHGWAAGWPEDHGGQEQVDPDLAAAGTAHPAGGDPGQGGYVEDYDQGHYAGADHPLDGLDQSGPPDDVHTPIGYGDLSAEHAADLPVHVLDGTGFADLPVGADPDLHPLADADLAEEPPFPPTLDLDAPEPVDGYPWTDPATLGPDMLPDVAGTAGGPGVAGTAGGPGVAELFEYAGEQPPADGDGWAALLASDDPATSALARWWSTGAS